MRPKKPNTLQQKLGFLDDDLKKPKHDDIMLWLDKNAEKLLNDIFYESMTDDNYAELLKEATDKKEKATERTKIQFKDSEDRLKRIKNSQYSDDQEKADAAAEFEKVQKKIDYLNKWTEFDSKPTKPPVKINSKIWELPVTTQANYSSGNSSKYTVGFVDMAINFSIFRQIVAGFSGEYKGNGEYWTELKEKIRIDFQPNQYWIYFEVKTEINSLGELIRQIRHYEEYLPGKYYIVSPDDKFRDTLKEQRIGFIKYS